MSQLKRRGFTLGNIPKIKEKTINHNLSEINYDNWKNGYPILLKKECLEYIDSHKENIKQTESLVGAILEEENCDSILAQPPYNERLEPKFQSLGSVFNEVDQQEIETIVFDVMDKDKIISEDIWLRASWLSFNEEDCSLRFRFSFGIDLEEDVAADHYRQQLSAELTDKIFPESAIITQNKNLTKKLTKILENDQVNFVERIIYFNSPNGGAYLHHDLERGHAGVVFAQITGSTFWLALPKSTLVKEIIYFSNNHPWPKSVTTEMQEELEKLMPNSQNLSKELESLTNNSLIHLINETEEFVQFLISRGHSKHLEAGDILLLPQETAESCCWHSVFCTSKEIGQALSFAIRRQD